jgi:hypothetical protein
VSALPNLLELHSGEKSVMALFGNYVAGCRITPVLGFWTGLPLHWVKFTF